jgi:tRNA (guanine-N7-)-methyltransferase
MRRTVRQPLEALALCLLEPAADAGLLDWRSVFGNDHPVEIEVGFGKGLFLLTAARANPDVNYLGIEIERQYQLFTANRIVKANLPNVRLSCADAQQFLPRHVPDGLVQAVHIYFPDPWWKRRHRKRRLFTAEFVQQCVRILRTGGWLSLASDVEEYFGIMQALLASEPELAQLPVEAPPQPTHDLDYLTNFERKYRKEGKPIFRTVHERR